VVAGSLISVFGLVPVLIGYGVLVSAAALAALLAQLSGAGRAQGDPEPSRVVS
jgi:hypothetical protein